MSFKLGGIVIEDLNRGLTAHEKLILACYASFALHDGSNVYAAQSTIAGMAMCSERMVRKALDKFQAAGVMVQGGKKGKGRLYRIIIARAIELYGEPYIAEPCAGMGEGTPAHGSGVGPARDSGTPAHGSAKPKPCAGKAEPGSGNPGNPGLNPGARAGATREAAAAATRWADRRAALEAEIGAAEFEAWVGCLGPLGDDGEVMRLACPTRFIRDYVEGVFKGDLERILKRRVELVVCSIRKAAE